MQRPAPELPHVVSLAVVLLVALMARREAFWGGPSMWEDEIMFAFSVLPGQGVDGWIHGSYRFGQLQPPLAYWVARLFQVVFGTTETALRLPSALAGIGVVALLHQGLLRRAGAAAAAVAAFGLATSGFHAAITVEARPYALAVLLFVASWFAAERALERPDLRRWGLVALLLALLSWTHNMIGLTGAAAIFALVAVEGVRRGLLRDQGPVRPLLGGLAAALLGVVAWMPAYLLGKGQGTPHQGVELGASLLGRIPASLADVEVWRLLGQLLWDATVFPLWLGRAATVLVALGAVLLLLRGRWIVLRLLVLVGVALLATGALTTLTDVRLYSRYLVQLVPFHFLLLGLFVQEVMGLLAPRLRRPAPTGWALAGTVAAVVLVARTWAEDATFSESRPDFRGAAEALVETARPGDLVFAMPWVAWYHQDALQPPLGTVVKESIPMLLHLSTSDRSNPTDYLYFVGWQSVFDEGMVGSTVDLFHHGRVHMVLRTMPDETSQAYLADLERRFAGVHVQVLGGTAVITVTPIDEVRATAYIYLMREVLAAAYPVILNSQGMHLLLARWGANVTEIRRDEPGTRSGPPGGPGGALDQRGGMPGGAGGQPGGAGPGGPPMGGPPPQGRR